MVEKRKKLKFVKTKSPSKHKKEYDHISKEASKTDSEDSSNFCWQYFQVKTCDC